MSSRKKENSWRGIPRSQSIRWSVTEPIATNGAVLSTAGNLVFQGQGTGEFAAYSADSGRKVWSIKTGSAIHSVPVSFSVRNEQYILVPVGWGSGSRLFSQGSSMATPEAKRGPARLLAFKLGAKTPFPEVTVRVPPVPKPPEQTFSKETIQWARRYFRNSFASIVTAPTRTGAAPSPKMAPFPICVICPRNPIACGTPRFWGGSHQKQRDARFRESSRLSYRREKDEPAGIRRDSRLRHRSVLEGLQRRPKQNATEPAKLEFYGGIDGP